jgi:hypothetical protein
MALVPGIPCLKVRRTVGAARPSPPPELVEADLFEQERPRQCRTYASAVARQSVLCCILPSGSTTNLVSLSKQSGKISSSGGMGGRWRAILTPAAGATIRVRNRIRLSRTHATVVFSNHNIVTVISDENYNKSRIKQSHVSGISPAEGSEELRRESERYHVLPRVTPSRYTNS